MGVVRRTLAGERHLGHDEPEIGARLERDPPAHAVDDHLLEQLDGGLLVVEDGGGFGIERLALLLVEGVARLLHELVEALARLAPDPVLAVEAGRMKDAPEAAVGIEQRGLGIAEKESRRGYRALV